MTEMFRKRKIATPGYGHTPWNPIHGDNANLRQDGTSPFCAMMQVAAEDTYDDYVICRGFDTRILKFVDYAEGDADKPGISVAKPFGKRTTGTYEIGEIYPAFLPTQGNANYQDFRQVTYVPPSPVDVNWRVGQNPGVVTGGLDGGQPENLTETIGILYDHNGKVVNWLLIDSKAAPPSAIIEYVIVSLETKVSGPYTGLIAATAVVKGCICGQGSTLIDVGTVEVIDHGGCFFDQEDMTGYTGWAASNMEYKSLDPEADPGELSPCHYAAINRCCAPDSGVYA